MKNYVKSLKGQIRNLRSELEKVYNDPTIPYEQILKLSQELDTLIVEYHKLHQKIQKRS